MREHHNENVHANDNCEVLKKIWPRLWEEFARNRQKRAVIIIDNNGGNITLITVNHQWYHDWVQGWINRNKLCLQKDGCRTSLSWFQYNHQTSWLEYESYWSNGTCYVFPQWEFKWGSFLGLIIDVCWYTPTVIIYTILYC